jgi:glutamine amidotransferase
VLISDSRVLYAHCGTRLCWLTRRAPFGRATLIDADMSIDFTEHTGATDIVTVIATAPLTRDEPWRSFARGELRVFRDGESQIALLPGGRSP